MADAFENAILRLLSEIGPGESISPADAAREAAQEIGVEWEQLLRAIRRAAVKLALEGRAVILLKGEAVDPEDFRGVYRIGVGDEFTPRKAVLADPPPPAPESDDRPEPHPYAPPAPPPSPAAAPLRVDPPAPDPAPQPWPPAAISPAPPPPAPDPAAQQPPGLPSLSFEELTAPEPADIAGTIEEGTPVTRYEFEAHGFEEDAPDEEEPDFLAEAQEAETLPETGATAEPPAPPPPLSFDDEDEDEDAHRPPRAATLDDIASQLERYLAAQFDDPTGGDAEVGDNVVRLPRQQDE